LGNPDQYDTATNVILTDMLPAGTQYVSAYSPQGNCSFSQATSTVSCTFSDLLYHSPLGGSGVTITIGQQPVWQDVVTLVVQTPASGATVQNTVSLTADQQLTGTTSATASVIAQASSSGGSSGGSSQGSSGGGSTTGTTTTGKSGGGAANLLVLSLLGWAWRRRASALVRRA